MLIIKSYSSIINSCYYVIIQWSVCIIKNIKNHVRDCAPAHGPQHTTPIIIIVFLWGHSSRETYFEDILWADCSEQRQVYEVHIQQCK